MKKVKFETTTWGQIFAQKNRDDIKDVAEDRYQCSIVAVFSK